MKLNLILKGVLVLFFMFIYISIVNADVGIYTPIGKPQITDISYSLKGVDENGLDLSVKNIGQETGSFQLAVSCTNNWEVYSYGGYTSNFQLASGDTKNVRIALSCNSGESCYTSVNCEISVEDTYGSFLTGQELKDTRKIGFQAQHPSYCGTSYQVCETGMKQCGFAEGESTLRVIQKCNQYCNKVDIERTCDYKCINKNGVPTCLSLAEEKSQQTKSTIWWIVGLVIAGIIIFLIVQSLKKKNKK